MRLFAAAIKELITLGVKGKALCDAIDRLEAATLRAPVSSLPQAVEEAARAADEELPPYDPAETRRRLDRERKRKKAESSGKIPQKAEETQASPTCTQVVTPSLPSLRSEELKPPEKTTSSTPKGAETGRGTRIAENWWPVDDYDPSAFGLSREQHDAELAKFLDYWRSVPGAKGRKTDWPATWRNWMRRASENQPRKAHERPDHDPKFAARQANYARALAGADSAAGRTWKP